MRWLMWISTRLYADLQCGFCGHVTAGIWNYNWAAASRHKCQREANA